MIRVTNCNIVSSWQQIVGQSGCQEIFRGDNCAMKISWRGIKAIKTSASSHNRSGTASKNANIWCVVCVRRLLLRCGHASSADSFICVSMQLHLLILSNARSRSLCHRFRSKSGAVVKQGIIEKNASHPGNSRRRYIMLIWPGTNKLRRTPCVLTKWANSF